MNKFVLEVRSFLVWVAGYAQIAANWPDLAILMHGKMEIISVVILGFASEARD